MSEEKAKPQNTLSTKPAPDVYFLQVLTDNKMTILIEQLPDVMACRSCLNAAWMVRKKSTFQLMCFCRELNLTTWATKETEKDLKEDEHIMMCQLRIPNIIEEAKPEP